MRRQRASDEATEEQIAAIIGTAFRRCRPYTRTLIAALSDVETFEAGQTVVAQGDQIRTVLVLDGHVAFRRTTVDGREVMPRVVGTGQLAALMPIALRPTAVEVVAVSACRVALLPGRAMWDLAASDAGFALDLLEHALLTYEAIIERLDSLMYQKATQRVARILEQHAAILFGDGAVLTRAHLPALVGTSPEMTRRVLRVLETHGVVARLGGDRLELLDADRLARTAAPSPSASLRRRRELS